MADKSIFRIILAAKDNASAVMQRVSDRAKALQSQIRNMRKAEETIGKAGVAVGAGLAVAGVVSTKAFMDAESAITSLKSAMMQAGGIVPVEFGKIKQLAEDLGGKLPGSTADFSAMMATLVQQGQSAQNILGGLGRATALLSVRLGISAKEAAVFASKVQESTGTSADDMLGLMDTLQRVTGSGVSVDDAMGAFTGLNTALRMLKKTGLDGVNAVAPLIVMMDQVGMKGDTAANAINKIMSLAVNAHKVKKANKEFGLSLNFLDKKGNFAGLDKLFAELKKITNLSDSRRAGVFAEIFGTDKETGDALAVMINKGNAGYAQTLQNMRKQADLQSRVNAELGTMRNILDAAAGSATNMAAALVGVMAPQLKVVADGFGKFAEFVRQVIDDNPALIKAIVATTGTVLGLVAAVKGVSIAIGVARAAAVVASANPLIAGAIGLAAAGVGAYTYFSGKSDPPKAVSTQGGQSQANINVNIANAPAGTRVETTSSNNTQIKSNVGYTYAGAR